ncbi:LPXTG-motif cell wall-anchored protein [Altererythrobacter atlanticus]|uniref:Uncharacterized protein n=1 Tax=Croceibacterium atlanticum TaxID=1267766 RepID=A0A0F7KSW5_9SPHN|nr:LPXTG cell wall anchor domain-containing protein [Croceibacterium atlanticum]AKH42362.1 hypothetical protein WYH_01320 [Croceibacterium atlanticum]MBB5731139.1 LPXTG-motif cell wall-anchored protein [Croceibacterium atlanticum]
MRAIALIYLAALIVAQPAAAAGTPLSEFRLPGDSTATPTPQGPVDQDIPAPSPVTEPGSRQEAEAEPAPALAPVLPQPIILPETAISVEPAPRPAPHRMAEPQAVQGQDAAAPSPAATAEPEGAAETTPQPGATSQPITTPIPEPADPASAPSPLPAANNWLPFLLAAGLALAAALAVFLWRRKRATPIERPAVQPPRPAAPMPASAAPQPPASPSPAPPAAPGVPPGLQVGLEPVRLSLSLMNATLSYRLLLANRGGAPLTDIAITADMIAAHASQPREQQLAGPAENAPVVERIGQLEPGERRILVGECRLPKADIVPIRQGASSLLVPLARFRVLAKDVPPFCQTYVVGLPPKRAQAGLLPFRLDLGPRVYPELALRAFA